MDIGDIFRGRSRVSMSIEDETIVPIRRAIIVPDHGDGKRVAWTGETWVSSAAGEGGVRGDKRKWKRESGSAWICEER